MSKYLKPLALCSFLAFPLLVSHAAAAGDHNTLISCYAYVHGQCYGNGANNCSKADYNWGLSQCDGYYKTKSTSKPRLPSNLASRSNNTRLRAMISASFKN